MKVNTCIDCVFCVLGVINYCILYDRPCAYGDKDCKTCYTRAQMQKMLNNIR